MEFELDLKGPFSVEISSNEIKNHSALLFITYPCRNMYLLALAHFFSSLHIFVHMHG